MNRRIANPGNIRTKPAVAAAVPSPKPRVPARPRRGLRPWREQHAQSFRSSLSRIKARPWATTLTLLVMSLALTLPLLLWLLLDNARVLGGNLDDARAVSVFLKPGLDAPAAQAFAEKLRRRADVAEVTLKTPEQGLEEFRAQSGFADALKVLQSNPLPTVLIVMPKPQGTEGGAAPPLVVELERESVVDLVQYDALWRQRLDAILVFTARAAAVLATLLALAALLVVGNTVRMDISSRADEITVVQLLGANNAFVRRPFLYTGLVYGAVSGLLALLTVVIVEIALSAPLGELTSSYGHRFAVHGLTILQALALFAASAVLGWLGAWLATSRHLASGQPQ
jgi:cell division transport system permease protein